MTHVLKDWKCRTCNKIVHALRKPYHKVYGHECDFEEVVK